MKCNGCKYTKEASRSNSVYCRGCDHGNIANHLAMIELLAEELHRQYRATEKAMNRADIVWRNGCTMPNPNILLHDHGFSACGKQKYFRKRAHFIISRSKCTNPQTLGEAEQALQAMVLQRRLIVNPKL